MKFSEAVQLLKVGKKVTRQSLKGELYFQMIKDEIKSFAARLQMYFYDENIMISDGWLVSENGQFNNRHELTFPEIIPMLLKGHKAKLKSWEDTYIIFDQTDKRLVCSTMECNRYIPEFSDFLAEDWIEL